MAKLKKYLNLNYTIPLKIETKVLVDIMKEPWFLEKAKQEHVDLITEEFIISNWNKIIDKLDFIYHKWDGNYNARPHPTFKKDDGTPLMIKDERDNIWKNRRDYKKELNRYFHSDMKNKGRFFSACMTVYQENKEWEEKVNLDSEFEERVNKQISIKNKPKRKFW